MSAERRNESSAASPLWGNGGGSCTCSGYARPGEPAVFDSSRCPVHAKPLPEARSAATECHICHRMQNEPGEVWCSYPHPLGETRSAASSSRSVWKYDLRVDDRLLVEMPRDAELLHVGNQTGEVDRITLWALVDPCQPNAAREVFVRGTGHPAPDAPYVGSTVGALVWHVFDGGDLA